MRLAIACILLCSVVAAGEPNPEAETLKQLSNRMNQLEGMLRQDRHDVAVQVEGKLIESSMGVMIEKMEKEQSQQQQQQQQQNKQDKKQTQRQQREQQREQSMSPQPQPGGGQKSSVPPGDVSPPATVTGKQSPWARLPKAQRDELLQAYGDDIPVRWRKRLEAYFYSIAIEEEKDNEQRHK